MPVIQWEKKASVGVITMCHGANLQDLMFVEQMNRCFEQALADKDIFSIVLTSSDEKNFCQGINLDWLQKKMAVKELDTVRTFLFGMNDIFKQILLMPVPVIAAINGHAFGNGAILACACDFRFMKKDKGYFCFPEVDIGIPFFPGMIKMMHKSFPEFQLNKMILSGSRVTAKELEQCRTIEKASQNATALMADALAFASGFQKKRGIFRELKKRINEPIISVMDTQDKKQMNALDLFT